MGTQIQAKDAQQGSTYTTLKGSSVKVLKVIRDEDGEVKITAMVTKVGENEAKRANLPSHYPLVTNGTSKAADDDDDAPAGHKTKGKNSKKEKKSKPSEKKAKKGGHPVVRHSLKAVLARLKEVKDKQGVKPPELSKKWLVANMLANGINTTDELIEAVQKGYKVNEIRARRWVYQCFFKWSHLITEGKNKQGEVTRRFKQA